MAKRCPRCSLWKPDKCFWRCASQSDGKHAYCKPCLIEYEKERRLKKTRHKLPAQNDTWLSLTEQREEKSSLIDVFQILAEGD